MVIDTVGGPDDHRLLRVLPDGGRIAPVFPGDYRPERAARAGVTVSGRQVRLDGAQMADWPA
ncbi:hypothetical protein [Streptomyces sp. NPDC006459]|uniref:hypothetical protein n=1 Tax=Streptomyces sp. NPDC006459 TaxID=3154303 RepID=UPI0033B7F336